MMLITMMASQWMNVQVVMSDAMMVMIIRSFAV